MSLYSTDVLAQSDLVGYWRCTDASGSTITDFSTGGHNATITGGVTLGSTALVAGASDTSALFNGSTGYAQLAAGAFNWEYTQPWTLECVIKFNSIPTGGGVFQWIFGKKVAPGSGGIGFQIGIDASDSTGAPYIQFKNGTPQMSCYANQALTAGTKYHLTYTYDGSGTVAGVQFWINGIRQAKTTLLDTWGTTTLLNSAQAAIGAFVANSNEFLNANLQELAIYNTCHNTPAHWAGDQMPLLHTSLCQNGNAIPSVPPQRPLVWYDNDVPDDIDFAGMTKWLCLLHRANQIQLVGVSTCDSSTHGASCARAIVDQLCPEVPVFAYQGNDMYTGGLSWPTDVQVRFRPQDSTNQGCTSAVVAATGTGTYVVGDKLAVSGGVLATGVVGVPTILQVATVSAGQPATVSVLQSGSYSTLPSNPVSVTGGGGSGATFTLTTATLRGNFTDPLQPMRSILSNAATKVWIVQGGFMKNFARLLASASNTGGDGFASGSSIITNHVAALCMVSAFNPNLTVSYINRPSNPDYNLSQNAATITDAVAVFGTNWPGTIISEGEESANISIGVTSPFIATQPPSWADPLVDPVKYAYDQYVVDGGTVPRAAWGLMMSYFIGNGFDPVIFAQWCAWAATNVTMTVNSALNTPITGGVAAGGNGITSFTAGNYSVIRRLMSDANANAAGNYLLAYLPTAKRITMSGGFNSARASGGGMR